MIRVTGDWHTHTTHSHGKGSMEDNVRAALLKGLASVAISDHGFSHLFYNIRDVDRYLLEISALKKQYAGRIEVFSCVELNLLSMDGDLDIPPGYEGAFDLTMFGYHKMAGFADAKSAWRFLLPKSRGKKAVEKNTAAYVAAVGKNKVDMISHPGYGLPIDKVVLAEACALRGTALEINAKHPEFTVEELMACAKTGVKFVIGSDAHSPERVGDFAAALARVYEAGLSAAQIVNAKEA
ncbi:MAG TPA: histidinol-phosphatase [Clostridiales bacterium]|nr:histidinol-phosphatase [Clostridiales bacterium]